MLNQLPDYLDDDIRAQLCAAIEEHLSHCSDCQIQVDQMRMTIVLFQHGRQVEMPSHLSTRLEEVLAREYQSDKAPHD